MDFSWGKHTLTLPLRNSEKHFFLHLLAWWSFPIAMLHMEKKSNLGVKKTRLQSLGNKLNLQSLCFTDKSVIKDDETR